MTVDESVHGMRLRVIERAQVLGNVSVVCRELGISRTLFYRWRKRLERYGVDGGHPRRQRGRAGCPVATPPEVERLVLGIAISAATWGCRRIAASLARTWLVRVAPSTVQRLLRRVGLATRRASAHRARAAGGAHGRAADRPHPADALARASLPHTACRGDRAGRTRMSGHLLGLAPRSPLRSRCEFARKGPVKYRDMGMTYWLEKAEVRELG
jgi:transposase